MGTTSHVLLVHWFRHNNDGGKFQAFLGRAVTLLLCCRITTKHGKNKDAWRKPSLYPPYIALGSWAPWNHAWNNPSNEHNHHTAGV